MKFKLKTKIWLTVLAIVSMFSFFSLYYFPRQQEKNLLDNYNNEVQNLANTISLGAEIALTEENFEGVQTAMLYWPGPYREFLILAETLYHNQLSLSYPYC